MDRLYIRIRGRVQGPFDPEKLRSLVRNGQLARFHDVSEDQQRWVKASDFPELFETEAREAMERKTDPNQSQSVASSQAYGAHESAAEIGRRQWHYAVGTTTYGPVDTAKLTELVRTDALGPDDQVWCEGMSNWEILRAVPELAVLLPSVSGHGRSGAYNPFIQRHAKTLAVGAILSAIALLIGAWTYLELNPPPGTTILGGDDNTGSSYDASLISSIEQLKSIESAVGKVVCGWEVLLASGNEFQIPQSMGSAFVVSSDGFMLTNRHVIDNFDNWSRATDDFCQRQFVSGISFERPAGVSDSSWQESERQKRAELLQIIEDATPRLWVFVDGAKHDARVVRIHDRHDLAILKVDKRFPVRFSLLGASPEPLLDKEVRAVGFPGAAMTPFSTEEFITLTFGTSFRDIESSFESRHLKIVVTPGRVSQVTRDAVTQLCWLQHSADIAGGHSGGPLVDVRGVVVGMNTSVVVNKAANFYRSICLFQLKEFINEHTSNHTTWENSTKH